MLDWSQILGDGNSFKPHSFKPFFLFKGGEYSKSNILDINYFPPEDKINKSTNYSQNNSVLIYI